MTQALQMSSYKDK